MKSIPLTREVLAKTRQKYILGIPYQGRTAHIYRDFDGNTICGKHLVLLWYPGLGAHHRSPNAGDPICSKCVEIVMQKAQEGA